MYDLIKNIISVPDNSANSSITYAACALLLLVTVIVIDNIFRFFKGFFPRNK